MSYTTIALVRAATGFNDVTLFPDVFIQSKIDGAQGQIDAKIGDAYTLPLPSTPPLIITNAALELAVTLLYIDQFGQETKDGDKGWEKRWNYVMNEDEAKGPLGVVVAIQRLKSKLYDPSTGKELPRNALYEVSSAPSSGDPQQTMDRVF